MLKCIARSRQPGVESRDHCEDVNPNSKQAIKSLTSQASSERVHDLRHKGSGLYGGLCGGDVTTRTMHRTRISNIHGTAGISSVAIGNGVSEVANVIFGRSQIKVKDCD
ncbi:hypothetical protein LguiA_035699 [Lonicera macranthoides]